MNVSYFKEYIIFNIAKVRKCLNSGVKKMFTTDILLWDDLKKTFMLHQLTQNILIEKW